MGVQMKVPRWLYCNFHEYDLVTNTRSSKRITIYLNIAKRMELN